MEKTPLDGYSKTFLKLIDRSPDIGDGWKQASDIIYGHIHRFDHQELIEKDDENKRVRFTEAGKIVVKYMS